MTAAQSLTVSVLLSCAAAAGVSLALRSEVQGAAPESRAIEPDRLEELARRLGELQSEQARMTRALDELQTRGASGAGERLESGQELERLVEQALARQLSALEARSAREEAAVEASEPLDKQALFASVFATEVGGEPLDSAARQEAWKKLEAAGLAQEAIAWFEEQAEQDPTNPDKRVEVGEAYLLHLQEVGNGPMAGVLATKADRAFDAALEIDSGHWNARFNKAVALSFWPPVFGKQTEAIRQFERLVEQQDPGDHSPKLAQTHLLLGNMYQQLGQQEKAQAAWQLGARLFPQNQALAHQLELIENP